MSKVLFTFHGYSSTLDRGEIYCGYQNKDNLETKAWDPKNIELKIHEENSYNLLDDDDFHEQLLKDENEHYLYTKERLFPFFDEEAREILIKFTRKFFKYAREQGCVGEFVEDVKNEVVNNVVVDEMDIKLEKVNRIINLLNKEWTIGVKKHIPFNLIDTGIIYSSIVEFIKNDKLEIRYTIDTNKKSSQHRNFALKYCTKILFFEQTRNSTSGCSQRIYTTANEMSPLRST